MTKIWSRFLNEPAIAVGIPTAVVSAAAGIWSQPWLSFLAAALAAVGTVVVRANVTADNPRGYLINQTDEH